MRLSPSAAAVALAATVLAPLQARPACAGGGEGESAAVVSFHGIEGFVSSSAWTESDFRAPFFELPGKPHPYFVADSPLDAGELLTWILDDVRAKVAPESWDTGGFMIRPFGGGLLLAATRDVHEALDLRLAKLASTLGPTVSIGARMLRYPGMPPAGLRAGSKIDEAAAASLGSGAAVEERRVQARNACWSSVGDGLERGVPIGLVNGLFTTVCERDGVRISVMPFCGEGEETPCAVRVFMGSWEEERFGLPAMSYFAFEAALELPRSGWVVAAVHGRAGDVACGPGGLVVLMNANGGERASPPDGSSMVLVTDLCGESIRGGRAPEPVGAPGPVWDPPEGGWRDAAEVAEEMAASLEPRFPGSRSLLDAGVFGILVGGEADFRVEAAGFLSRRRREVWSPVDIEGKVLAWPPAGFEGGGAAGLGADGCDAVEAGIAGGELRVLWTFSLRTCKGVPSYAAGGMQMLEARQLDGTEWVADPRHEGWCADLLAPPDAGGGKGTGIGVRVRLPGRKRLPAAGETCWPDFSRRAAVTGGPGQGALIVPRPTGGPTEVRPPAVYIRFR